MSKELDAIIQFIDQPNTDYAYMLAGAWGSGKTYFWKHIVVPRLVQGRADSMLIAYVSMYGMEKPHEIRLAVFGQLHPRLAKAGKYTALLAPALGITSPAPENIADTLGGFLDHLNKGKQLIICFDDLERTSMGIDIAMGQINQYVEHVGAKVVILCNEDEIRAENSDIYKKTKEKVIRITRHYSGDPQQVLPAIIAEFAGDEQYHKFLKEKYDLIADLVRRSGLGNLRALKYSLLVLQVAFKELSKMLPHDKAAHQEYLKILLPVSFDVQQRKIGVKEARSFLTQGNSAIWGAYMLKKDDELKPLAAFGDRYGFGGLDNDIPKSQACADLIETGYLDPVTLKAEIDERNAVQSAGQQAVRALLEGWFRLPDDAIKPTVAAALDTVRKGEIMHPHSLHGLANVLAWMSGEGVDGILDGTAECAFEEGISKIAAKWEVPEREIMFMESSMHVTEHETPFGKWVRELILKTNAEYKGKTLKEHFDTTFADLETDPDRFSFLVWDDESKGIGRQPIAPFISTEAFSESIFSASNRVLHEIAMAFRRRYSEPYKVAALIDDLQWLQDFHDRIQAHMASGKNAGLVSSMNLRSLQDYVNKAISRILQTQKSDVAASKTGTVAGNK